MNVLLGITGSVGSKLTDKLVKLLENRGHDVFVVATDAAKNFTNIGFTQIEEFDFYNKTNEVRHIGLADWADVYLIVPCTSNTLRKITYGFCDNIILSILKAFDTKNKKVFVAPVMNTYMLEKEIPIIKNFPYEILWPTVKKLACGSFGLGAMPELEDIVISIEGHKWEVDKRFTNILQEDYNEITHPGWFGATRKYDMHTGVDLYCEPNTPVFPFEEGEIVGLGYFTGKEAGCPWWNESRYLSIKGKSGIIIYGEINAREFKIGEIVGPKDCIGNVVQILQKKPSKSIPFHKLNMLHVELLREDKSYEGEVWKLSSNRPKQLKDPSIYLFNAKKV